MLKLMQQEEDDRLIAEWIEACGRRTALATEFCHPTISRQYSAQMALLEALKTAREKCHSLFLALAVHRKG